MRVGFDARLIRYPGVGRYIANALRGLADQPQVDLVVYAPDAESAALWQASAPAWIVRVVSVRSPGVREQIVMPRLIAQDHLDLFHAPHYVAPIFASCPIVVTLHDLVLLRFPDLMNKAMLMYYRIMVGRAIRQARMVLCDSLFIRGEVRAVFQVTADKLGVVPIGISASFSPASAADKERFARSQGLSNYLLYVGTWKPWKNVERLLDAFDMVRQSGYTGRLVLAGKAARYQLDLTERIQQLAPHVMLLGAVSENDLPALYSAADVLVMPSLYEGFGLPVLEAMACGTPVIVSQAGPLPEVAGEAGMYFDPLDVSSMAQAILSVVRQPQLRATLIQRGLAQAQSFSIARMGQSLYESYRAAHEGCNML